MPFYFFLLGTPLVDGWNSSVTFLYTLLFLSPVIYDFYYYWINNITYYKKAHTVENTHPLFLKMSNTIAYESN